MTDKRKNEQENDFSVRANDMVNQVTNQVRDLVDKGNQRRFIVRKEDGQELVNVTLTVAVALAVIVSVTLTPIILVLAAIGGILAKLSVEVAREIDGSNLVDMTDYVEKEENLKVKNGS